MVLRSLEKLEEIIDWITLPLKCKIFGKNAKFYKKTNLILTSCLRTKWMNRLLDSKGPKESDFKLLWTL